MSNTYELVQFLNTTKVGLSVLTERLCGIRYDLFGSRPVPPDVTPAVPAPEQNPHDMSLTDSAEYSADGINDAMNRLQAEIDFLRERVNHKPESGTVKGVSAARSAV